MMIELSLKQVLAGTFALMCAVSAAVFTIVTYAKEAEVSAYRLKIEMLDRRVVELERLISEKLKDYSIINNNSDNSKESNAEKKGLVVNILHPISNQKVPQFIDVQYSLGSKLPIGYKAILVVKDPLGQWWSWGESAHGIFSNIQIGTSVDRGKEFEVRVMVTNRDIPKNEPRYSLPSYLASKAVKVIRE